MNRFPNEVRLPPCRQAPRHQTSVPLSGKAVHTCGKRIAAGTKRHPISQIMSQGMRVLFWTHRRSGKVRVQGGATIFTASSPRDDGTPVCSLKACKVDDASPFLFCCPPSLLLPVCTRTHTHTAPWVAMGPRMSQHTISSCGFITFRSVVDQHCALIQSSSCSRQYTTAIALGRQFASHPIHLIVLPLQHNLHLVILAHVSRSIFELCAKALGAEKTSEVDLCTVGTSALAVPRAESL